MIQQVYMTSKSVWYQKSIKITYMPLESDVFWMRSSQVLNISSTSCFSKTFRSSGSSLPQALESSERRPECG